jgi:hypothetical protein
MLDGRLCDGEDSPGPRAWRFLVRNVEASSCSPCPRGAGACRRPSAALPPAFARATACERPVKHAAEDPWHPRHARLHAVALRTVHEVLTGILARVGGGVGVLVVRDADMSGSFSTAAMFSLHEKLPVEVPPSPMLVAPTLSSPSVPFSRRANKRPCHNGKQAAEVRRSSPCSHPWATAVDVAIAATHGAGHGAEIGAQRVDDRLAKGDTSGLITNQRAIDIFSHAQSCTPSAALKASWPLPKIDPARRCARQPDRGCAQLLLQHSRESHEVEGT